MPDDVQPSPQACVGIKTLSLPRLTPVYHPTKSTMADNEILPAQSEVTEEHGTIGLRGDDPNAPKPWCYMIVTPDPRNSTGATNYGATVRVIGTSTQDTLFS